jgi:hypothetical protein
MKNIILSLALFLLFSCGENSTRLKVPDDIKTERLSFATYSKYCGPQNLNNTGNYKKFKGVKIVWSGTVYSVVKDDSSPSYANKVIKVKMKGSSSLLSDVTLRMPNDSLNSISKLAKGDIVKFEGTISYIGSKLMDHIVVVSRYKFSKPKKKKKKK